MAENKITRRSFMRICGMAAAAPAVLKAEPKKPLNELRLTSFEQARQCADHILHASDIKAETITSTSLKNVSPCPYIFKGGFCRYAGPANWCDGSFRRCREIGNVKHFGGCPVIGNKRLTVINVSSIGDMG